MATKPGAVPATAGEIPFAGDHIAAINHHGAGLWPHAPGEHGARISAPNLISDFWLQIGRRHGTAGSLTNAPGSAGIGGGDHDLHLHEIMQWHFFAAEGARQQGAEQRRAMQRIQQFLRQGAVALDLIGGCRDNRRDAPGAICGGFATEIAGLGDFLRCAHTKASSHMRAGSCHWVKAPSRPCTNQSSDQIPSGVISVNFRLSCCPWRESA